MACSRETFTIMEPKTDGILTTVGSQRPLQMRSLHCDDFDVNLKLLNSIIMRPGTWLELIKSALNIRVIYGFNTFCVSMDLTRDMLLMTRLVALIVPVSSAHNTHWLDINLTVFIQ
jgi:hypothetical protein